MKYVIIIFWINIVTTAVIFGQEDLQPELSVFFDCDDCDESFLQRNLEDIVFAREPKVADIHVLVTDQSTGGGGEDYRFQFIGRDEFESIRFELSFNTLPTDTEIEVQRRMLELIHSGLKPFSFAAVNVATRSGKVEQGSNKSQNRWNFWVFEVSSRFSYSEELRRKEFEFENEIDVERITNAWRIRMELEHEYEENKIDRDEGAFISSLNRGGINASAVRSLGSHWSAGVFSEVWSNTVNNIQAGARFNAALEYNFFPYQLSHQKEFTVAYRIGPRYFNYLDETIFNETTEQLFSQSLRVEYDQLQPWGRVEGSLEGFHYLHDFSKNRIELETDLFFRLVKGLFLRLGGEFQLIHDQIYLPKGDASLEEILLERKALATDFEFEFNVGLSYTFGAIGNNVVNTRL